MKKKSLNKIISITVVTLCILVVGLITFAEDNKISFASDSENSFDFYRQSQIEPKNTTNQAQTTKTTNDAPAVTTQQQTNSAQTQTQTTTTTTTSQTAVINQQQTVTTGGETTIAVGIVFVAIVIAYIKTQTSKKISVSGKKAKY